MELLTSDAWINPQIDYLLWLQNIRNMTGGVFDGFFLNLSKLGELLWPTIAMCIIYWCIDFKAGLYIFTLNSFTLIFSQLFKMIACVYRPWVLDSQIAPPETAFKTAGGYSFPSGHSMMAISSWGGIAFAWRKNKFVSLFFAILVLMIAFSRNYLGVHTPQDVVGGLLIGVLLIFVVNFLINWCEKDKNRYLAVLFIADLFAVTALYYILTKNYPADYINGKLLVNPQGGIYIAVLYFGWVLGILNGAFLCRRYFPFDASKGSRNEKIVRGVIGTLFLLGLFSLIQTYLFDTQQNYRITFGLSFFVGFFITAIYPLLFEKVLNSEKAKKLLHISKSIN